MYWKRALLVTYFPACSIDITDNEIHTTLAQNSNQRLYLFDFDRPGASNSTIAYNTHIVINNEVCELFNKGLLAIYVSSSSKVLNFTIFKSFAFTGAEINKAVIMVNITTALRFDRSNKKIPP